MNAPSFIAGLCMLLVAANNVHACNGDTWRNSEPRPNHIEKGVTVEEVLQRNLEAVRVRPSESNTENTDKLLRINEADYSLIARYRASSDGYMRIDVFDGDNRIFSEGKDDAGVWEWPSGKDAPDSVSHDGVAAVEHGIEFNLFPMAELSGRGHEVELVGGESVRHKQYFVLKVTLSDGFETYRYVNAETWLVDFSRDFRAFHPGIDSTKKHIETRYDRWSQADGVVFAGRSRNIDLGTGEVIATTLVLKSNYNRPREELDLARNYVPTGVSRLIE